MEVEALIEAVRKRQLLYDKSNEDYSNRVLINQMWIDVAQEVGIDGATARKKWAVLRDSFRRHHKKETTYKSGSGSKQHKTWYLYKSMLFLLPFAEDLNSSTTSSLLERLGTDEESQQTPQLHDDSLDTLPDIDIAPQAAADMQAAPSPSLDPQPSPSLDPQPGPSLDPQPSPSLDPQSGPSLDPQPSPSLDPQSGPSLDPQSGPSLDPQSGPSLDPQPGPSLDPQSGPSLDPRPGPSLDPQPGPSLDPQSGPSLDPQPSPSLDPRPGPSLDPQPGPSLDPQSGPSLDPQSGPSLDPQPGPSLDPRPGPINLALPTNRPTKHNARKRPYPAYPQSRASQSVSPFDVAMLDALKNPQQQQQHQVKDDDEHFLMSLLPVMKSLDPITKLEFRGELNNTALRYLRLSQQPRYPNLESTSTGTASASNVNTYQYSQYSRSSSTPTDEPYQYHQFQQYTTQ